MDQGSIFLGYRKVRYQIDRRDWRKGVYVLDSKLVFAYAFA